MALDDMREAKAAADQAVDVTRRLTGDASERAHAIALRASVEDQLGDTKSAERDCLEASRLYASSVGTKHFFYLQNENLRGQLMHFEGRHDEGLRLIESTTAEIEAVRPASNTLANSLTRLAEAHLRDGAFESANQRATEALKLKPAQQNATLLSRLRLDRANALVGLGRFAEATTEVAQATQAASADGKASNYMTVEIDLALAAIALAQGKWADSQALIDAAKAASAGETRRTRHQRARMLVLAARLSAAQGDAPGSLASAAAARRIAESNDLRGDVFLWSDVTTAGDKAAALPIAKRDVR